LQPVYTVQDSSGTQWKLQTTQSPVGAGTYVYSFRAANPGATTTTPNTITIPSTIVLGVTSVNNPTIYTTLGINEESDQDLRIRRQTSVSISAQGYYASLLAALQNVSGVGVGNAFIHENVTGATDVDGIPGHSIWVIVGGSFATADVANAIYQKRSAGCGMFGAQTYNITQADGSIFTIYYDIVTSQDLFINFTATSLNGTTAPDIATIKSYLAANFKPGVYEQVNINDVATLVQQADNNCLVTGAGVGTSLGTYVNAIYPTAKNNKFAVTSAKIIILPMILTPTTATVASGGATKQFTGLGGYGALTYSVFSGAGSINSSTGLFTSAGVGTTVIRATDTLSNFASATITVA
jgi:hypothetical protein